MMTTDARGRGPSGGGTVRHIPVLLDEVINALNPHKGGTYIDATFGAGGYTRAVLQTPGTKVIAIDRDPHAISAGQTMCEEFGDRLTLIHGPFSDMQNLLESHSGEQIDGVMFDIGVSSMQIDDPQRGFSFMNEGALDMRMAQQGTTAAEVVNTMAESDLADLLYILGEEKRSRAIARAIVEARKTAPIATTTQLAEIIVAVLGKKPGQKIHPATRSFQALRIYVNGELQQLVEGLAAAENLLKEGGRIAIVTFHSLEDRIAKRFLQERAGGTARPSRHLPELSDQVREPSFKMLSRRPTVPSDTEIAENPRARSAKLRAAERTGTPPFPHNDKAMGLPDLP